MLSFLTVSNVAAISVVETKSPIVATRSLNHISQGSTITKDYFLYTDWLGNSSDTIIYRCRRSGSSISGCKELLRGHFIHANALGHKWGSNYFSIYNVGNPNSGASWWCYDLNGKPVSKSMCKPLPAFNTNTSGVSGGAGVPQGNAQYGDYFLKGYAYDNKVLIYKKGRSRPITQLNVGHTYTELEDVFIDGDTGVVYFTTSSASLNILRLHKTNYKMPKFSEVDGKTYVAKKKTLNKDTITSPSIDHSSESTDSKSTTTSKSSSGPATAPESTSDPTQPKTAILTSNNITELLRLVLEIMSIGVPFLGILGITIVGVQYLTAGNNEEKARKAKRRLFEIVIGLVIFALLFALLKWLGVA